ncbi:hypothetical protein [Haloferula sp. BvORR071]|uniref:hypothetical protein n=1 Tax=Haloferula sp. BvORR071 TaxID=1396141 RepID=UPI002240ED7D|nr:hypothetical protein [Haloferula sp. BvORR071]
MAWIALLDATHAAAFLLARGARGSSVAQASAAEGQAAALAASSKGKSSGRERDGTPHARLLQKLMEADLSRADFERARARLLNDWAKHDLRAVLDLVYGPDSLPGIQNGASTRVLMDEILRNPDEVLEWIHSGRFGSKREQVEELWTHALREAGQYDKIFIALRGMNEESRKNLMRDMATNDKSEVVLTSIREALGTWYQQGSERMNVIFGYTHNLVRLYGNDPNKLFEGETDPLIMGQLAKDWTRFRFGYPPTAERLGEIRELPEATRATAIGELMGVFDDQGIAGVKRPLEELARQEMWSELTAEGTRRAVLLSAGKEKAKGGTETFETVMRISDPATRALLMQAVGGGSVPENAGEDVFDQAAEVLDPGPELDGYLAGMARSLAMRKNLELARAGIARIGNADLQAQMLKELEAKKDGNHE